MRKRCIAYSPIAAVRKKRTWIPSRPEARKLKKGPVSLNHECSKFAKCFPVNPSAMIPPRIGAGADAIPRTIVFTAKNAVAWPCGADFKAMFPEQRLTPAEEKPVST